MKKSVFTFLRPLPLLALLGTATLSLTACQDDAPTAVTAPADPAAQDATIQRYLSTNGLTGAQRQTSGLYYVPVKANTNGTRAKAGNTVQVLYTGKLLDGTVFDASSRAGNVPFSFVLGRGEVIQGWDEGIALMRKGETGVLLIPSALAYGTRGAGSSIGPNAVLRFDVELVEVK